MLSSAADLGNLSLQHGCLCDAQSSLGDSEILFAHQIKLWVARADKYPNMDLFGEGDASKVLFVQLRVLFPYCWKVC